MAALTLGLVGREHYDGRVARNEAFNHAGNAANAVLAAVLSYVWGLAYVAAAIGVTAIAAGAVMLRIDPRSIDHEAARGGQPAGGSPFKAVWSSKPLLLLAAAAFAFQTASGATLPFIAQALTSQGHDPSLKTGAMTVLAQVSMIAMASLVPALSRHVGHPTLLGAALLLVALRTGLAATNAGWWSIGVIQILEGLSTGLAGVAIPAIVAKIMTGTGHASAGLGGVLTAYGAGAALSPVVAGSVAQALGFPAAFIALGAVALIGLGVWIFGVRLFSRAQEAL